MKGENWIEKIKELLGKHQHRPTPNDWARMEQLLDATPQLKPASSGFAGGSLLHLFTGIMCIAGIAFFSFEEENKEADISNVTNFVGDESAFTNLPADDISTTTKTEFQSQEFQSQKDQTPQKVDDNTKVKSTVANVSLGGDKAAVEKPETLSESEFDAVDRTQATIINLAQIPLEESTDKLLEKIEEEMESTLAALSPRKVERDTESDFTKVFHESEKIETELRATEQTSTAEELSKENKPEETVAATSRESEVNESKNTNEETPSETDHNKTEKPESEIVLDQGSESPAVAEESKENEEEDIIISPGALGTSQGGWMPSTIGIFGDFGRPNQNEFDGFYTGISAEVAWRVSPSFQMVTGVGYREFLGYEAVEWERPVTERYTYTTFSLDSVWVIDSIYAGHWRYDTTRATHTIDSIVGRESGTDNEQLKFNYVEMPIRFDYRFERGRWALGIGAGPVLSQMQVARYSGEGIFLTEREYFGLDLVAQPSVGFAISEKFEIELRGGTRHRVYTSNPNLATLPSRGQWFTSVGLRWRL